MIYISCDASVKGTKSSYGYAAFDTITKETTYLVIPSSEISLDITTLEERAFYAAVAYAKQLNEEVAVYTDQVHIIDLLERVDPYTGKGQVRKAAKKGAFDLKVAHNITDRLHVCKVKSHNPNDTSIPQLMHKLIDRLCGQETGTKCQEVEHVLNTLEYIHIRQKPLNEWLLQGLIALRGY